MIALPAMPAIEIHAVPHGPVCGRRHPVVLDCASAHCQRDGRDLVHIGIAGYLTAVGVGVVSRRWMSPWAWVLLAVLFLGGAQLLCLGIFGEYLGRTYAENKRRPLFFVRETLGFDEPLPETAESLVTQKVRSARAAFD